MREVPPDVTITSEFPFRGFPQYNSRSSDVIFYARASFSFRVLCSAATFLLAGRAEWLLRRACPSVRRCRATGRADSFASGLQRTALHRRIHERRSGVL